MSVSSLPQQGILGRLRANFLTFLSTQGVLIALALLILFGWWRYDGFLDWFNVSTVLRYNSMFALVALGMCFVIMTGGIDLSVGAAAALSSVAAAYCSAYGTAAGIGGGMATGLLVGLVNGIVITGLRIQPFIATLATMLACNGTALLLAKNQSVSIATDNSFMFIGLSNFLGLPIPAWIVAVAYLLGWLALERMPVGRRVLAIGDGEATAKLMGLKVERTLIGVYLFSGLMAGTAGMILASSSFAGQPTEGVGWELIAIASVVVGGTLLSGGVGSVGATLAGAILLGLVFTVINFENGKGWISLSSSWQPVIRGLFLLAVVVLQAKLAGGRRAA
jgi:galactofuranose transport system permease protein